MSGFGAAALLSGSSAAAGTRSGSSDSLEKIDMSLDDIIKLNKKEERKQYSPKMKRGLQQDRTQQFRTPGSKWGIQQQKGYGKNHLGPRKKIVGKKHPYGVITGLAAKKAMGSHKGISPLNRQPLSEKNTQRNYPVLKKKPNLRRQTEMQRKQIPAVRRPAPLSRRATFKLLEDIKQSKAELITREVGFLMTGAALHRITKVGKDLQDHPFKPSTHHEYISTKPRPSVRAKRNNMPSAFARIGNKLSQQKDTRQATFLFRRGLKVQAQVQPTEDLDNQTAKRTRQWRTSTTSGGILTVSIENPGAIITPISQKLRLTRTPVPPFLMKRDQSDEKKIPKGVPLQFDINSVGKQTGMTLNERFGILKEQRTALSQSKGSRFVTVG